MRVEFYSKIDTIIELVPEFKAPDTGPSTERESTRWRTMSGEHFLFSGFIFNQIDMFICIIETDVEILIFRKWLILL